MDQFKEASGAKFQILRFLVLIVSCLSYFFVYFHRSCTSVLAADMAKTYSVKTGSEVTKADLSIFSSIFFYPYGFLQFFAGILADIIEPAFLVGGSQLIASIGAVVCGASNNLGLGCFGRVLVGLGCGPTYVPCTRMLLNWFPAPWYATLIGVLAAIGCPGGIVAALPLVSFKDSLNEGLGPDEKDGWRWGFYGMGAISAVLSIFCLIFIRGHPNSKGFKGPNGQQPAANPDITLGDRFRSLGVNLKVVGKRWDFWVVVVYCIIGNAPMFSFQAMWAASFIADFFHYDATLASRTAIATTVGIIIGSLGFGPLSSILRTRKWVCLGVCLGAAVISLVFFLLNPTPGNAKAEVPAEGVIWLMLIVFGATTIAIPGVAYPLVREYYPPAQAGTAVGVANSCGFLSTAVYQEISTAIIKTYGKSPKGEYPRDAYRYGLWVFYFVSFVVSGILVAIVRDSDLFIKKDESKGSEEGGKGMDDVLDEVEKDENRAN